MMSIYFLNVVNVEEEESEMWPFSSQEKAINFIHNNFAFDQPRKVTDELFEGKVNNYIIESQMIDQERMLTIL